MSLEKIRGYAVYLKPTEATVPKNPEEKSTWGGMILPLNKVQEEVLTNFKLQPTRFGINNKNQELVGQLKKASSNKGLEDIKTDGRDILFVVKKYTTDFEGNPQSPPIVGDKDGNPLPEGTLIGNGSIVEVTLDVYTSKKTGKTGATLEAVQVIELKPYVAGEKEPVVLTPIS